MPPLLRPRLVCHYCGERSKSKLTGSRKFKCERCESINFLDEAGEITDVPYTETELPRQYAHPVANIGAEPLESSVFCSTCTKNQQLLTEALSNYLPSPEDPEYAKYEASLPAYTQNLEDRYPQVCAICEPRVRERIRQAGYHAKSDHLRRMMERSRARQIANRLGWRSLVVTAGGLGYCASIAGQLTWHAMSALSYDLETTAAASSYFGCLNQCVRDWQVSGSCAASFTPATGLSLVVGLLCIWWNPQWHHKLDGREGRLIGLGNYYKLQVAILFLRFASWIWLREPEKSALSALHQKPVHSVFLVLQLMLTTYSLLLAIRVDTTPLVSWQDKPAPLLSRGQYVPPQQPRTDVFSAATPQSMQNANRAFPVSNLASVSGSSYDSWRPPTPPEDSEDAMEWEPTSINPQFNPRPVRAKATPQESPFHGTLPALPGNRFLRPGSQALPQPRQAIGVPPGFFDRAPGNTARGQGNQSNGSMLAEPKFFPQSDRDADTGLEGMFDSVFSLNGAPPEVRQHTIQQTPEHHYDTIFSLPGNTQREWWSLVRIFHCFCAVVTITSFLTLVSLSRSGLERPSLKRSITFSNAAIPAIDIVLSFSNRIASPNIGVAWFITELCMLLAFGTHNPAGQILSSERRDILFSALVSVVFWQELYLCMPSTAGVWRQSSTDSRHMLSKAPITAESEREIRQSLIPSRPDIQAEVGPSAHRSLGWQSQSSGDFSSPFAPRPRSNSIESTETEFSTASTATTSGWKTPKRTDRGMSQSPGFSLGGLALDDGRSFPSGRSSGPAQRYGRRRAAF